MDKLVATFINDNDDHEVEISQAAGDMQNKLCNVFNLVEELGPHLTAKEVGTRIRACSLLGSVLQKLPDDYLATKELSHLTEFLCARLQDHYTLQPFVLSSLVRISCSSRLDKDDARTIIDAIFKEIHVQSCLQAERNKFFQILVNIFDSQKDVILQKGQDFVYNYVQAVDGEQDPRNLLIIFQLSSDLVKGGIELGNLVEEFFEVASCYFPIEFDPSAAGKKSTITNQDLVQGLRQVISSTDAFAKYWIPLCLEKMESDIESAKLDSILTLTACLPVYKKCSLESFLTSIWSRLRQEITHVVSQEVEKNALDLLTQLVKVMSLWPEDNSETKISDLHSFLSAVLSDCLPRLAEPIQDKLTWMSGLILLACAKGSVKGCSQISSAVISLLLERANKIKSEGLSAATSAPLPMMPSGIHNVVEYMVKMMSVCSKFTFEKDQHPLATFCKDLLLLFTSILTEKHSTPTKCLAVAGIACLIGLNLLLDENLITIADCFTTFFTGEVDIKLSTEILSASGFFASKYPHIIKSHTLPKLFKAISDENPLGEPIKTVKKTFLVLSALSTHFDTMQEVVSYVVKLVEKCQIDEASSDFLSEILNCMQKITKDCAHGQEYVDHLSLHVALPLIKRSIKASIQLTTPGQCCTRCDTVEDFSVDCVSLPFIKSVAIILRNICQQQRSSETANLIVQKISGLFLDKDVNGFDVSTSDMNIIFEPFNPNFSAPQTRTICFVASSLCSFDSSVNIPRTKEFMEPLIGLALHSLDQPTYVSAAKSFAGLLNKHHKSCGDVVKKVQVQCKECLQNSAADKQKKLNVLTLLIWTTKALILCNHVESKHILSDLLSFLNDDDVGEIAASGFDIILRESEEVLNFRSHAVIRMMYRQRFFMLVLPHLIAGFDATNTKEKQKKCSSKKKANHLTALSHLLIHIPKQVLLQEFPRLLPLLIHSLHSSDPHLLHSVLSALFYLLQDASDLMEGHIDTLLDDFLALSRFANDLNVRLKAVQCIGVSTLLSALSLLPLKNKVIKSLSKVLDDPKRDVRSEAAKARSEWFFVGV